ncbi:hypothetical protein ACOME3_008241 [Neoechinorhynchus agilis]
MIVKQLKALMSTCTSSDDDSKVEDTKYHRQSVGNRDNVKKLVPKLQVRKQGIRTKERARKAAQQLKEIDSKVFCNSEEDNQNYPNGFSEHFVVEEVLDKRISSGRLFYLLKWQGYSKQESTWEPIGNCHCKKLIEEFEVKRKARSRLKRKMTQVSISEHSTQASSCKKSKPSSSVRTPKKLRQLKSEITGAFSKANPGTKTYAEIVGIVKRDDDFHYAVKTNEGDIEVMSSPLAQKQIPGMVMDYYESKIELPPNC